MGTPGYDPEPGAGSWPTRPDVAAGSILPQGAPPRYELGRDVADALLGVASDHLVRVMLHHSFRLVADLDLVPVLPCPYCLPGHWRLAGTVRGPGGYLPVHACDVCRAVAVGEVRIDNGTIGRGRDG